MMPSCLGGDALVVIKVVMPFSKVSVKRYLTETSQCLGFGSRARQVARGQTKKRRPTGPAPLGPTGMFPII